MYHTDLNDEATVPFFVDVGSAEKYLGKQAEAGGRDRYAKYSLYQAKARKVVDGADVLTDQSGIRDFLTDADCLSSAQIQSNQFWTIVTAALPMIPRLPTEIIAIPNEYKPRLTKTISSREIKPR